MRTAGAPYLVAAALLCAVIAAGPAAAEERDVNAWGTATYVAAEVDGDWTYTWSVTWAPIEAQTDGLTWYLTGIEFQPDGTSPIIVSTGATPAGWSDMLNPNDGWLSWFANGSSPPGITIEDGLAAGTYADAWSGTFTPTGGINPANYQLLYTAYNPASGRYITERASLTANNGCVPEPASAALLLLGAGGLGALRRRRK